MSNPAVRASFADVQAIFPAQSVVCKQKLVTGEPCNRVFSVCAEDDVVRHFQQHHPKSRWRVECVMITCNAKEIRGESLEEHLALYHPRVSLDKYIDSAIPSRLAHERLEGANVDVRREQTLCRDNESEEPDARIYSYFRGPVNAPLPNPGNETDDNNNNDNDNNDDDDDDDDDGGGAESLSDKSHKLKPGAPLAAQRRSTPRLVSRSSYTGHQKPKACAAQQSSATRMSTTSTIELPLRLHFDEGCATQELHGGDATTTDARKKRKRVVDDDDDDEEEDDDDDDDDEEEDDDDDDDDNDDDDGGGAESLSDKSNKLKPGAPRLVSRRSLAAPITDDEGDDNEGGPVFFNGFNNNCYDDEDSTCHDHAKPLARPSTTANNINTLSEKNMGHQKPKVCAAQQCSATRMSTTSTTELPLRLHFDEGCATQELHGGDATTTDARKKRKRVVDDYDDDDDDDDDDDEDKDDALWTPDFAKRKRNKEDVEDERYKLRKRAPVNSTRRSPRCKQEKPVDRRRSGRFLAPEQPTTAAQDVDEPHPGSTGRDPPDHFVSRPDSKRERRKDTSDEE